MSLLNSSEQLVRVCVTGCTQVQPDSLGHYVRLNVGGMLFNTTLETLTKRDSMLRAMFTGEVKVLVDAEGWVLIDRCGKHFCTILNYLRDGYCSLPTGETDCEELLTEAQYYLVEELIEALTDRLFQLKEAAIPLCKVPIITSTEELERVMSQCRQPVIRFVYNRSNNKYSYTGSSEEHLLKNMELFDKLALCFQGRVVFIKDVAGQDICTWHFYGARMKQAEVCCQSIVYAKDRKHIKIDFPEVRVYEEVLHIMLFENAPIQQIFAGSPKGGSSGHQLRKRLEPRKVLTKGPRNQVANDAASPDADGTPGNIVVSGAFENGGASSGPELLSDDDEIGPLQVAPGSTSEPSTEPYDVRIKRGHAQLSFNSKLPNVCRIPIVTEAGEFETIRQQTWRPIIRFVYNRSGNHFSYTSSSDECFLKNVELFDRLSVCFQERVLFVKDVVGNDVCSWYYYGHHKLRSEVSCQTIVYGSDKRQLRIDFPEARILEDVISIMIFQDHHVESQRAINALERMATVKRNFGGGKRGAHSDDSD